MQNPFYGLNAIGASGGEIRGLWDSGIRDGISINHRRSDMEKLESKVNWEPSLEKALGRARQEKKPVLLDFFKDG